jgi:DNA polymerase (family 10)
MLSIPEVGPKTVQLVYKELGITNISELEKAAREGKIRNLFRMGEKTEKNILKGIEFLKRSKGRILLGDALPFAEKIINILKELKEVEKISPAGSLRRGKETIGDLDILITSSKPKKVMEKFIKLPFVKEIIAFGETKSSILTDIDLQVDLRVVENESFGAALQYFTGSKEHNIALRELAIKKNLKINEYGVFKGEEKISGEREEDVYEILGLKFIQPEMRENWGEIEIAKEGKLPELINLNDIKGDLQVHSDWSDGSYSIEELAEQAIKKGYQYLAITDHCGSLKVAGALDREDILKQIEYIQNLNRKFKNFYILTGIEVNIKPDGSLDMEDEILKKLEIVIAGVHTKFKQTKEEMTERIIRAMKNPNVDMIAHPSGRVLGEREPYEVDWEKIFKVAKETGTILEINSYPKRLDLKDIYVKRAKESGIKIAINTDAHHSGQLDFIQYGVITARRGWLEKKDVINTYSLPELKKF